MEEKVKEIMARVFEVPAGRIDDGTSPDTLEQWDSLHHLHLILALEENFGLTFTEDEIVGMMTFVKVITTLKEKLGG
jgi:acyl carrier protein